MKSDIPLGKRSAQFAAVSKAYQSADERAKESKRGQRSCRRFPWYSTALEQLQELLLQRAGQRIDVIQKERAAAGLLHGTRLAAVPKQLGRERLGSKR